MPSEEVFEEYEEAPEAVDAATIPEQATPSQPKA